MTRTIPNKLDAQALINSQIIFDESALTAVGGATPTKDSGVIYMDDNVEAVVLIGMSLGNAAGDVKVSCLYYIDDTSGWVERDHFNLSNGILSTHVYNFGQDAIKFEIENLDAVNGCTVSLHMRVKKTS